MTAIDEFRPAVTPARSRGLVRPLPCYEPDGPAPPAEPLELSLQPSRAPEPPPVPPMRTLCEAAAKAGAHVLLRLMLEVLDGRRPVAHLAAGVTAPVLRYVVAAAGSLRRAGAAQRPVPAGRLRSLRVSQPCDEVAEVSAVCQLGGRIRAVAARFELDDASPLGWRCTAVRLG
ncbi:MAG: Rv3235 family protein [Pseudonocardia sp.]